MLSRVEAIKILAGASRTENSQASAPTNIHMITGTVSETSEDGRSLILIDGLAYNADNTQTIAVDTLGGLEEGDTATILLTGEAGHAMTPIAIGSVGSIDRIVTRVSVIESDYVKADTIEASVAFIDALEAGDITAAQVEAAAAYIGQLTANSITAASLQADVAKVHSLSASDLSAATAYISDLSAGNLTASQVLADHATVGSLDTNYAHISNGVIDNAEIGYADVNGLSANYAHVSNGVIDNAKIGYADVNNLSTNYAQINLANVNTAQITNGIIQTASIVDEQVFTVTGNKATIASIDASKINVSNLNADNITVNKINGQTVTGKSISDALTQHETDISTKVDTTTFNSTVSGLNDRIDGAIETFTGTVVPTLNNTPASAWNTNTKKDQHIGDVYYVVNANSDQNGYCYRFTKSGSTYSWQLIKDSDVTAALSRLQTAEGKITTFDSDISTLKTDTGQLKTQTQNLETSLGDKVDVTTFNELSSDVSENSSTISSMSTVLTNNGLTSSTNITNTVNSVSQTASSNSSSITSLQQVNTANGLTSSTNISNRASLIEQDLSGYKTTVSNTYATKTSLSAEEAMRKAHYATCATAAATAAKVATLAPSVTGFSLYAGCMVTVRFQYGNSVEKPTLNVNSTGAKKIVVNATENPIADHVKWGSYATCTFVYDGAYWRFTGSDQEVVALRTAETRITQTENDITLRATKTEAYQLSQPNLSPFFSMDFGDVYDATNNPKGYWYPHATLLHSGFTKLEDGWAHFSYTNSGGSSYYPKFWVVSSATPSDLKPSTNYTFLLELRDWSAGDSRTWIGVATTNATYTDVFAGSVTQTIGTTAASEYRISATTEADITGKVLFNYAEICVYAGDTVSCDMRLSLYEGEYAGPYKPYVGGKLYASQAELKVANDEISTKVEKDGVISSINQSAETVKIQAAKVEIDGTAVFNAISSNVNSAITSKGYATTTQVATAKSEAITAAATDATNKVNNLQVGGRNLLGDTDVFLTAYDSSGANTSLKAANYLYQSLKEGDVVTVSIDIDADDVAWTGSSFKRIGFEMNVTKTGGGTQYVGVWAGNAVSDNNNIVVAFTGSLHRRISKTFTLQGDLALGAKAPYMYTQGVSAGTVSIGHIKLEKGNKASEWSPAPEDLASASDSVEYIAGTQTTATNLWTGVTKEIALVAGKTIAYHLPYAGTSSAATLNLTLSGGGTTGAKAIKYNSNNSAANNVTTHYGAGSVIQMTYDGTQWRVAASFYDTGGINNARYKTQWANAITAATAITAGRIICGTSSGYKNIAASVAFDLSYPLMYADSAIDATKTGTNNYITFNGISASSNGTITAGAANYTLYLKGTVSSNTFTIAASPFLTCTPPNSADGYFYIPLGVMYSATAIYFNSSKDLYAYIDGKFRQVNPTDIVATQKIYYRSKVSGTVAKPTAWVTETGNKYNDTVSVGNSGWSMKVTPIANGKGATVTKYLYLYSCEQRKRLDGTVECTTVTLDESTTVIDGGNIITNTVTAEQIAANTITADNMAANSITLGKMPNSDKATILNSNVVVGGRNLLLATGTPQSKTMPAVAAGSYATWDPYNMIGSYSTLGLTASTDYVTISFDWSVVSAAANATVKIGTNASPWEYFGVLITFAAGNSSGHVEKTFTVSAGLAACAGSTLRVRIDAVGNAITTSMVLTLSNVKLETGNKATAWSPAPEDQADYVDILAESVDETINGENGLNQRLHSAEGTIETQGKTLTSTTDKANDTAQALKGFTDSVSQWLTFNGSEGMTIGDTSGNYQRLDSTSQRFYSDGIEVMRTEGGKVEASSMDADEVHVGEFMWVARSNGHTAFKWAKRN